MAWFWLENTLRSHVLTDKRFCAWGESRDRAHRHQWHQEHPGIVFMIPFSGWHRCQIQREQESRDFSAEKWPHKFSSLKKQLWKQWRKLVPSVLGTLWDTVKHFTGVPTGRNKDKRATDPYTLCRLGEPLFSLSLMWWCLNPITDLP